jgi:Aldehyde dehydrogenase family
VFMLHNLFDSLQPFPCGAGRTGQFYSLPQLGKAGVGPVSRLPVSIRIVLESVLRNYDGKKITEADVRALANWGANAERSEEIPFVIDPISPFGGYKQSGIGRELGKHSLELYPQIKSVYVKL